MLQDNSNNVIGRFNGAIQIFIGSTLVAMVTKIGLFSQEIGHNSARTNTTAADFAPNMGLSETADLMLPFKFLRWPILVATVTKFGLFLGFPVTD